MAFTLAETLIVMGIIGVVAALTIPNLNSSTGEKEKIAKFKKLYQNTEDAVGRATAVYGPMSEWCSGTTDAECRKINYERVSEFLKLTKTCKPKAKGCWTEDTTPTEDSLNYYTAITADGSGIFFGAWNGCTTSGGNPNTCAIYLFDIDGPYKGKSKLGSDVFRVLITENGVAFENTIESVSEAMQLYMCYKYGYNCERWIMTNDNMDYLKVDSSGKCPNGKYLNWTTNTSCK